MKEKQGLYQGVDKMRIWGLSNQAVLLLATRAVNIINQLCCGSRLIAESCLIAGAGTFFSPPSSLTCSAENTQCSWASTIQECVL